MAEDVLDARTHFRLFGFGLAHRVEYRFAFRLLAVDAAFEVVLLQVVLVLLRAISGVSPDIPRACSPYSTGSEAAPRHCGPRRTVCRLGRQISIEQKLGVGGDLLLVHEHRYCTIYALGAIRGRLGIGMLHRLTSVSVLLREFGPVLLPVLGKCGPT